jgi:TolB-like protein/Flp pilus assembly protein TadD
MDGYRMIVRERGMPVAAPELRLGRSVVDIERGEMRCADGGTVVLRPKTLALLLLLARHAGRLVTRAEILDTVWGEVHVTDDSITQCVVELRRALGPDAGLLRTVPKRGYVLDGVAPAAAPPPAGAATARGAEAPVLAVLPFRPVAGEPDLGLFGLGVLEGVVGALATLREPVVISANTTQQFGLAAVDPREAGRRLGAGYVASGTLRRAGAQIRLTVELAEARGGAVLWQRPFDIQGEDGFEAQDRIAAVIANTLAPRVQEAELVAGRRQRPIDLDAYRLLIEARRLILKLERSAFDQAGALLARAVALDPGFAPIRTTLADWHSLRVGQGWSTDRAADTAAVEDAVAAALAGDAQNARALAMLGHNETILRRRHDDAVALFDRALAVAPNDAEALLWSAPTFAWMGDGEEAVRRARRAMALSPDDPLAFRYQHFLSIGHYVRGDLDAAAEWGLRSARANPNYTSNLRVTAAALAGAGRLAEARPLAAQVMALEPGFRVAPMIAQHAFRDDAARQRYGQRLVEAGLPG